MKIPKLVSTTPVIALTASLLLVSAGVMADSEMDHSKMNHGDKVMDHSQMDHSKMTHGDKAMDNSQMDHSKMNHGDKAMSHSEMDHSKMSHGDKAMDHSQMDHGDMKTQGGKAPADARDPHAYSGGYTLADGPYAIGVGRQLILADEHRFYAIKADKLEHQFATDSLAYELQGWYGTTFS